MPCRIFLWDSFMGMTIHRLHIAWELELFFGQSRGDSCSRGAITIAMRWKSMTSGEWQLSNGRYWFQMVDSNDGWWPVMVSVISDWIQETWQPQNRSHRWREDLEFDSQHEWRTDPSNTRVSHDYGRRCWRNQPCFPYQPSNHPPTPKPLVKSADLSSAFPSFHQLSFHQSAVLKSAVRHRWWSCWKVPWLCSMASKTPRWQSSSCCGSPGRGWTRFGWLEIQQDGIPFGKRELTNLLNMKIMINL